VLEIVQYFFCRGVREIAESKIKKVREVYISPYCWQAPITLNFMKFGIRCQLNDEITFCKFLINRFRDYRVLTPPKLPFPIDLLRRTYNSAVRHCDILVFGVNLY